MVGEAGLQRGNVGLMQFDMPCSKAFVFCLPGSRQIAEYSFIYLLRFHCSARADCVVCPYCLWFFFVLFALNGFHGNGLDLMVEAKLSLHHVITEYKIFKLFTLTLYNFNLTKCYL